MTDKQTVPIGEAKGRPMLHWVGKRPLDYVTAFPAQLVERFDETLLLLKQAYGWRNVHYVRQNVTGGRPLQADLPPTTLDLIAEYNQLDLELYKYVATRFEQQVRQQGPKFPKQVRSFQATNRLLARIAILDLIPHGRHLRDTVRQRLAR